MAFHLHLLSILLALSIIGDIKDLWFYNGVQDKGNSFDIPKYSSLFPGVESVSVCPGSGTLTAPSGTIKSPGYPSKYSANIKCSWTIVAPYGSLIKLSVDDIYLESCYSCDCDSLQVFDGKTRNNNNRLLDLCRSVNHVVYSSDRMMYILFLTDANTAGRGFKLSYTMVRKSQVCIGSGTLNSTSGTIMSPGYPSKYFGNVKCWWRIVAPYGYLVKLTVDDIFLEDCYSCGCDSLQVFDGETRHNNRLAKLCKTAALTVLSSHKNMYLSLSTDALKAGRGFKLSYSIIPKSQVCPGSGILNATSGTIVSPGYPSKYFGNVKCWWKIVAPYEHLIKLTVDDIYLEDCYSCRCDSLQVFDGETRHNNRLAKLCKTPALTVLSSNKNMFLSFSTDAFKAGRGFKLSYSIMPKSQVCLGSGILNATSGTIVSPGYPSKYFGNVKCWWKIVAPYGHLIKLTVDDIYLEDCYSCRCDSLQVFDGETQHDNRLAKNCKTSGLVVLSADRFMYLLFSTDVYKAGKGFNISYSFIKPQEVCPGSGILTAQSGTILSPRYPSKYSGNVKCWWKIVAPYGYLVKLSVDDIYLEDCYNCRCDSLQVFDGETYHDNELAKLCKTPGLVVLSSDRFMYLLFSTDVYKSGRGFKVSYSFIKSQGVCPGSGILTAASGSILSPGYPSKYFGNVKCWWKIIAPYGYLIKLSVDDIYLENCYSCRCDSLQVFDGATHHNNKLAKVCITPGLVVLSSDRYMYLFFSTSVYKSGKGFKVSYSFIKSQDVCPGSGLLTATSGSIISPGYPSGYFGNVRCWWKMTVPYGYFIKLSIDRIHLQNCYSCRCDSLQVFDGESRHNRRLAKVCTGTVPNQSSSGRSMYLTFSTDVYTAGQGFNVSYSIVKKP